MSGALLAIEGLGVRFGGVVALKDVALSVSAGSVHGLIGPNGAGKTTLLNCITRLVEAQSGSIRFEDRELLAYPAHHIAGMGVARTFQNFGLIGNLTVLENVMVGLHARHPATLLDEMVLVWRRRRFERDIHERARRAIEFIGLAGSENQLVGAMPYGRRKAVEFARAIAGDPRLLLLDEPTAGLNAAEMDDLRDRIIRLRAASGMTIVVITHHLRFLSEVADRVTVLDLGRSIADGTPSIIRRDPRVVAAYVGTED